uniref:Sensory neuron membrane protein 2 n=3 Tax=Subpsaltria yangi TaxID=1195109 RepID=A0A385IUR6_9HEMI|nr:sensory neuron membrane protein 2d [Subpsaltria yangi]
MSLIFPSPENRCYCDEENVENCLKGGVRDMTPCLNAPIIASFPHLYLADKEYQSYITGLHPNKTLHETYVDIDPLTGYPLQGAKRMQLNMFLEKIDGVDILANVSTGLLPLVWIEEGLAVNEELLNKFGEAHHKIYMLKAATVAFIILCIIVALCALVLYLYMEKLFCFKNITSNRVVALFQMSWQKDKTDGVSKATLSTIPADSLYGDSSYGNRGHYPHQLVHRSNNAI